ncbi:SDA1 family protein [Aaosphaeria arxii CBS 175.79]|uniref:Protein SDA1 n=1 Tax=Aaosphaeria arxii CBS 175.79 TaxID=1450172 RepID=A0A6A5X7U8_9PLEO|nr:SDA1 family protein [Aaosphaeria arxii CBS 175.79]KAF2009012.1 SDA1 family protein [Aaosphaeria arxii CBS 175.79]
MKRKVGALEKVEADLTSLRYRVKRDPPSYEGDFIAQYELYQTYRDLFLQNPATSDNSGLVSFRDQVDFVTHCSDCYPSITKDFPTDIVTILRQHHAEIEPDLREKLVGSLCLLRNKEVISSEMLLGNLFPLLIATPSKSLRPLLYTKIISELRNSPNTKASKAFQTSLYNLVTSDRESSKALWSVKICREMWRRQVWTDSKAVEIQKEATLSDNEKVIVGSVRFFLGGDREREEAAEESSDDEIDMGKLRHQAGINKKTKKKERDLKKAAATVKRKEKKKSAPHPLNFSAFHLLHDPQGFAETLWSKHLKDSKSKLPLESKLLVLNLVTRLVGLHQLTIISLYSWFLKYLTPRQTSVTSFLACLAQATHNFVPGDVLEPLVTKIANEFVSEASAAEVAASGLNAIREICARQPMAMNDTLLQDLVLYRKSKDKGTMMAAKGLLSLYREVGAELLNKRDRGKDATMGLRAGTMKERRFGEQEIGDIQGIELLEQWKEEERRKKREAAGLPADIGSDEEEEDEAADWKNWDVESDDSDSSTGWINVESDGEDINVSDSEDEKDRPSKKAKVDAPANDDAKSTKSEEPEAKKISKLLTTTILTPADLAKLKELQLASSVNANMASSKRREALLAQHADDAITAETIEAAGLLGKKKTKEEKIAMAKGDREENHQSTTAKRKEKKNAEGKSTTNKEKARKKNFLMTLGKAKGKQKRSLVDVRKTLRGHLDRQKRGGRRGNK